MDLLSIKKKLNRNAYKSINEFKRDVSLICENCMIYNIPKSEIYIQAAKFQKAVNKVFKELKVKTGKGYKQIKRENKYSINI